MTLPDDGGTLNCRSHTSGGAGCAGACAQREISRGRRHRPELRFHRILLEEWAHIRPWRTDRQRTLAYAGFMHFYNHHRSHGALGWATPIDTLNRLHGDNLPAEHS